MTRNEILEKLAPCGLDCSRCASFKGGDIAKQSQALLNLLGNYKRMADNMSSFFKPFEQYDSFEKILSFFADAGCAGCRSGDGKYPDCAAKSCFREKGVDFCGECGEFPCEKNTYNDDLHRRWLKNGETIRDEGAESFYALQVTKPRY
ncbi:MAG: DUF3795 domain-containing protein [Spirochaetales bacterium]|nr:DUF3795 domain-containing protein [Spirochaetales bacterium]